MFAELACELPDALAEALADALAEDELAAALDDDCCAVQAERASREHKAAAASRKAAEWRKKPRDVDSRLLDDACMGTSDVRAAAYSGGTGDTEQSWARALLLLVGFFIDQVVD